MPSKPLIRGALAGLLLAILAGGGYALLQPSRALDQQAGGSTHPALNRPAPEFTATTLDGAAVDLRALRGRPVWINFWATWCPPCKAEMPLMEQQYQQHQAEGLVILGVNLQESPATVRAWTQDTFHWSFVIDTGGHLADLYNLEGVPSHVFIDRAGVIKSIHVGDLAAADMATNLAGILPP
ncbi:MAG TPA: TlpA disulfide reductase family protein [Chloroflexia bacterium]|nr:TlpA disulfide reductase family protein [Chloroflexia bacterium]